MRSLNRRQHRPPTWIRADGELVVAVVLIGVLILLATVAVPVLAPYQP